MFVVVIVFLDDSVMRLFHSLQSVLNATRTVFGKHADGHIFPMLLNVKSMDNSFAGVLQELHTDDHFVLFLTRSLVIKEATLESLRLLNVC